MEKSLAYGDGLIFTEVCAYKKIKAFFPLHEGTRIWNTDILQEYDIGLWFDKLLNPDLQCLE